MKSNTSLHNKGKFGYVNDRGIEIIPQIYNNVLHVSENYEHGLRI